MGKYDPQEVFPEGYVPISARHPVSPELFVEGLLTGFTSHMNDLYGPLVGRNDLWDFALDLAFHDNPKVAFRGSWALEWAYFDDRGAFAEHIPHFVANFLRAENGSVHRHYTKMLWDMIHRGSLRPAGDDGERIAEKCFDLLMNPQTKTAVRVWAMEILYELSPQVGWVEEHLCDVVRQIMDNDPSRGLANRSSKVLRRIGKRAAKPEASRTATRAPKPAPSRTATHAPKKR